jgi:hypothetical protein
MRRVLRHKSDDDGSFDRELWRAAGTNAILTARWHLVNDSRCMRGRDFVELLRARSDAHVDFPLISGDSAHVRRSRPARFAA